MKTQIIKKWNSLEPGIHDLPEIMVARLKKYGYAKDPEPKPAPKPKAKPKAKAKKKTTKEEKAAYETKTE